MKHAEKVGALIGAAVIVTIIIVTGAIIGGSLRAANKSKCLDSQAPRRWHNAICEQYEDGEWIQFDPFEEIDFYYNSEGEKIE